MKWKGCSKAEQSTWPPEVAGTICKRTATARNRHFPPKVSHGGSPNGQLRNAFGEQDGDASGHNGGRARACAKLDADRPIMEADRVAAGAVDSTRFSSAESVKLTQRGTPRLVANVFILWDSAAQRQRG